MKKRKDKLIGLFLNLYIFVQIHGTLLGTVPSAEYRLWIGCLANDMRLFNALGNFLALLYKNTKFMYILKEEKLNN